MKKDIHPENYRPVVFKDMSNGDMFLSRSTCKTNDTVEFEGETYPVVKLEISSSSHPFYTGKSKLVDTAGRVDRFANKTTPQQPTQGACSTHVPFLYATTFVPMRMAKLSRLAGGQFIPAGFDCRHSEVCKSRNYVSLNSFNSFFPDGVKSPRMRAVLKSPRLTA